MRKKLPYVLFVFVMGIFFFRCKKDNAVKNESGQIVVQGNFTLRIKAAHHWWGVPYLPVYLKKNATTWPGTDSTKYEFMTTTDNEGNCEFSHLFPGDYYIYAHGFDAVFGRNVIGYGPVQLNSTTSPQYEFDFTLNVSE